MKELQHRVGQGAVLSSAQVKQLAAVDKHAAKAAKRQRKQVGEEGSDSLLAMPLCGKSLQLKN